MGAFDDLARSLLVDVATPLLRDGFLPVVLHEPWTGQNEFGEAVYGPAVEREAVVTDSDEMVRQIGQGGVVETIKAAYRIQFLVPVAATTRDRFTLPDGRNAPVLKVDSGALDNDGVAVLTGVVCG